MGAFSRAPRSDRSLRPVWAGSTVTGVLVLMTMASLVAQASPVATASAPQTWSTSVSHWHNYSFNRSFGRFNFTYNVTSFYGASDVITATNTSSTTTELKGMLTQNRSLVATWCVPNCTAAEYREQVRAVSQATEFQYLNFTTNATVYENGSAATALGITNASAQRSESLTEATNTTYGNWSSTAQFNESQSAFYALQFQSPLGIVPWNLSTNLTWNDSAAYNAAGGWNDSFSYGASYNGSTYGRNASFQWQLNRSGREATRGIDFGNTTNANNQTVVRIGVGYRGPIGFDSDLFMTAIGSDLFQGATSNWSVNNPDGYEMAGAPVTAVYAEHVAPSTSGTGGTGGTSGAGTTGSTSSGTTGTGGTGPGTSAGSGTDPAPGSSTGVPTTSPGSTTPGGSAGTPAPTSPAPGSLTAPGAPARSTPSAFGTLVPIVAILSVLGIGSATAAVTLRRRRSAK